MTHDEKSASPELDNEANADLQKIVANQSETEEQQQFNKLSHDDKLNRLNNLVKKSQIYSQIILDNILENTLNKKRQREQPSAEEPKPKKSKKSKKSSKRKSKSNNDDILSMLGSSSNPVSSETKSTKQAIENAQTSHTQKQPRLITGGVMKDYQLDGLEWLTTLYENGLNGILADDMGVGKTIQCIALICFLIEHGVNGPFFVVAPLSTVSNWFNEFTKFAPGVKVLKYVGDKQARAKIKLDKIYHNYNVVLTSYELSIKDFAKFNKIQDWKFLMVDEGHRLKNYECLLMKMLKRLSVTNRLLLTGTPLQNNLGELWSLLNFILPDIFHDLELFEQWFNFGELTNLQNQQIDEDDKKLIDINIQENLVHNLHTILKPFILRRLKKDVIKDLPPKKEYLIHIPMSSLQKRVYDAALDNKFVTTLVEVYLKEYVTYNHHDLFPTLEDYETVDRFLADKFSSLKTKKSKSSINKAKSNSEEPNPNIINGKRQRVSVLANLKEPDVDEIDDSFSIEPIEVSSGDESDVDSNDETSARTRKQIKILTQLYYPIFKEVKNLSLRNMVMQLRNICGSPYIYYEPFHHDSASYDKSKEHQFMKILFENSAKFKVLDQLLENLLASNHKVLIFSQFTKMLDLVHDWLAYKGIDACRLDGATAQDERDESIKQFNDKRMNKQVFLLSTRAGGLGINLIASDTVIILDNDWNPQVDLQAIDRVHRIGQTQPVKIYRFLVKNSIEEILITRSYSKRFLEKLIIQMGEFKFNRFKKIMDENDGAKAAMSDDAGSIASATDGKLGDVNQANTIHELLQMSRSFIGEDDKNSINKTETEAKSELWERNLDYLYSIDDSRFLNDSSLSDKFLTDDEVVELTRRDAQCYSSDRNDFPNVTVFETMNNAQDST